MNEGCILQQPLWSDGFSELGEILDKRMNNLLDPTRGFMDIRSRRWDDDEEMWLQV